MACGLPVIGGDSPGIRELIRHGENGWLCGTDAASIRQAIRTLLGDEALRRRLGQAARAFAVEHFSLDRVVELELEVLRQATEARDA
jgi:glycosyltransferase involved in cell wall biosynthesis